jgi:hypothetical protein
MAIDKSQLKKLDAFRWLVPHTRSGLTACLRYETFPS